MTSVKGFTLRRAQGAFTLIELLVVIGVIGVLSAGVLTAINVVGSLGKANLAKAKTFDASIQNSLSIDLIGEWTFDDGNLTTANDTSGYGINGTINGGITSTTDRNGENKAYQFASGNYITMGNQESLNFERTDSFTIAGWFKKDNVNDISTLFSKVPDLSFKGYYLVWLGSPASLQGKIRFSLRNTDPVSSLITADTNNAFKSTNDWYHIVVVYNGNSSASGISIYVNGVKQALTPSGDTLTDTMKTDGEFNIGGQKNTGAFIGKIDDFRVYKAALSAYQIQHLYARGYIRHFLVSR